MLKCLDVSSSRRILCDIAMTNMKRDLFFDTTVTIDPKAANIYLDLEDYLQGLLQMSSELSRFCINCVAKGDDDEEMQCTLKLLLEFNKLLFLGDTRRPKRIFKTLSDLQQAFSELNLKNDHLRRMFDGLKYV